MGIWTGKGFLLAGKQNYKLKLLENSFLVFIFSFCEKQNINIKRTQGLG
jgi:hypothetical protein